MPIPPIYSEQLRTARHEGAVVFAAEAYARGAHQAAGEPRKYTGEPYINHPARCAQIAREFGLSANVIAALWLHDVVEDTSVTIDEIDNVFGFEVRSIVDGLTNIHKRNEDGIYKYNRAERHQIVMNKLKSASLDVRTCRMIDAFDNLRDIADGDPKFARVFVKEKRDVLDICRTAHFQIGKMLELRIHRVEAQLECSPR